jgi:hypothetical protein
VGPPNSGKSSLLAALTHAVPEIADYPFSTRKPLPGMMSFENVQIQLVDLPPIARGQTEGWVFSVIRNADLALLVLDLQVPDLLEQTEALLEELERARILLGKWPSQREPDENGRWEKRAFMIGTKGEEESAQANLEVLQGLYRESFSVIGVSTLTGKGLEQVPARAFELLEIVRVYTKTPGREPSYHQPVVLAKGSSILEVASEIHKDFRHQLRYARIWGHGKYDGQRVERDHVVQDQDVVELHI